MGGKGQRRREKNFLASHGGDSRLPPPPKLNELDALPSKLRKIMEIRNLVSLQSTEGKQRKRNNADDKKQNKKDEGASGILNKTKVEDHDAITNSTSSDAKKKKRKRKMVEDLRFLSLDQATIRASKKQRKKEYFQAKKKQKKEKTGEIRDFPGREEVKFGEVVKAPPKLSFPKVRKAPMEASKERIRLQAVEAYRNRRGWSSRPGVQLPCA